MDYRPVTAVWEITMGCNMRCTHCGSACSDAQEGELSAKEALSLCRDIGDMGLEWVTISGGEPTVREDWDVIAKELRKNNVIPNIITNGWLFDEKLVKRAKDAGIATIAFSVDGIEKTHDTIRKEGSYKKIMNALSIVEKEGGLYPAVITTISKKNIFELKRIAKELSENGVKLWQLQYALPMGNMKMNMDDIIDPDDVRGIIDDIYDIYKTSEMEIQLADCIGYFGVKDYEIRVGSRKNEGYPWNGCTAGKYSFGILHNGDILGCTSVREKSFIEGNIRKKKLKEIWYDENSFAWNRQLKGSDLEGFCNACIYSSSCIGGCSNSRLTLGGKIKSENKYCIFNQDIRDFKKNTDFNISDEELYQNALAYADKNEMQQAQIYLGKAKDQNAKTLALSGYINFFLGRYNEALKMNKKAIELDEDNAYALKGAGLCLARLGRLNDGMEFLEKAMKLTTSDYTDPYYDTAVVLYENNRYKEAEDILRKGLKLFPKEKEKWGKLIDKLNLDI